MDIKEKQGHIGNLSEQNVVQLKELLDRQKNILKNEKFIKKLPDKGQKIKRFAMQIEAELQSRMDVDSAADLITKMSLNSTENNNHNEEQDILKKIINRPSEKTIIMETGGNPTESGQFINSYERVIKKADGNVSPKKFYPHRSLKSDRQPQSKSVAMEVSKDIVNLDEPPPLESPPSSPKYLSQPPHTRPAKGETKEALGLTPDTKSESETMQLQSDTNTEKKTTVGNAPTKSNTTDISDYVAQNRAETRPDRGNHRHLKHKYDESLEASNFGPTKFEKAKIISIEESVMLIQGQRMQQETIQAQHAAERLVQRMGVKMVDYEPKEVQMRYRNPELSESEDSTDSENDEIDYPD